MASTNKNRHLTLEERKIIEKGIYNNAKKTDIAATLGKDKSTIGKEIKLHRILSYHNSYPTDCSHYQKCKSKHDCDSSSCDKYVPFKYARRNRSPGACNGCSNFQYCRYDKYKYSVESADKTYRETLVDSREGVGMTNNESIKMGSIIKPLLDQGQSPYQIATQYPELNICEKTLYNYINDDISKPSGISNIDLKRKVSRKMSKKKKNVYKKRKDNSYLKGRTHDDYIRYPEENPNMSVVEMDTVYNDVSNGPFIQIFDFVKFGFLFGLLYDSKTSDDMVNGMDILEDILDHDLFTKYVEVSLTDRGPEFNDEEGFEKLQDGSRRTRIFYYDPTASSQKRALENSHREIRYIYPKESNLRNLGLVDQNAANLMFSYINSFPRESLNGKSPIEMIQFFAPELWYKFKAFGIDEIEKDKVILKPYLLKK